MTLVIPFLLCQAMEQKLKEAEEMHILLQLECEKYKSVLAETVSGMPGHLCDVPAAFLLL